MEGAASAAFKLQTRKSEITGNAQMHVTGRAASISGKRFHSTPHFSYIVCVIDGRRNITETRSRTVVAKHTSMTVPRWGWKRLKGCVFSPPSLCPVPARGREARKRNLSIASPPTPLHKTCIAAYLALHIKRQRGTLGPPCSRCLPRSVCSA